MIFQISPKLSVARDLSQTYLQTVPQTRPCLLNPSPKLISLTVLLRLSVVVGRGMLEAANVQAFQVDHVQSIS